MIVAPEAFAVEAGARVLTVGGNAVDAAVTCAFVQGVVDPHDTSIGGYLLLNLHRAADAPNVSTMLDAPATAGSATSPDMWVDRYIGPNPDGWGFFLRGKPNELGYTSICTPGTVRGLETILERWGTISLADAVEPAARLAETGFAVDNRVAAYWRTPTPYPETTSLLDVVRANREASRIYLKGDGKPYTTGETIRNPDYARTLRHLGQQGPDDFYIGELGRRISADLAAGGAYVMKSDLAEYRVRDVEPVTGTYRGYTIATSQSPHGGPTLIEILNILEGWDLRSLGHNTARYILRVALAMKAAFADRNRYLGDPDFADIPLDWMTSKERAAEWRGRIEASEDISVEFVPAGAPGTTHVSVVDRDGTCVALTHSLGGSSGVISPGLGFMYNNSMINFHPLPGHPNSIAPGKGRTTGMSPTIVYRDGRPVVVIGAPGATKIVTAVCQVIVNVIDFGMNVQEAVFAPRFDSQGGPILTHLRIPESVCAEIRREHAVERLAMAHGGLALVHAIGIDHATGRLTGGADAGSAGMALEV
ncbi:MAG TPA: gamma-glutamyltransferase family protein [Candidatus Limnocylindrales bacterium]|jgi:gamma-glutamyltranspeptidase/glutathione hydrolase|nr:gamma-glutamyltransferase family protein [Candidatus Limnocylindrales bacterium]